MGEVGGIARARLEAAETGAGIAEERGASRVELEMLNAVHALAWAVLALSEELEEDGETAADAAATVRAVVDRRLSELDRRVGALESWAHGP